MYILGTYENKLLYIARVTDVVTMKEYFSEMSKGRTDDIYDVKDGKLVRNKNLRNENVHTDEERKQKDFAGEYVILSDEFVYLGKDAASVDIVAEYNPKFQETKTYEGELAEQIVLECFKYSDGKVHTPTTPFKKHGGCR